MLIFACVVTDDRTSVIDAMAPLFGRAARGRRRSPARLGRHGRRRSATTSSPAASAGTRRTSWCKGRTPWTRRRRSWPGWPAPDGPVSGYEDPAAWSPWRSPARASSPRSMAWRPRRVPDLRIVHVASRSTRSARRRAAQTGGIACGYDELPGGADVVVVATPPALHRREAERAVGGSAVALVEAPLAATLDDADRLVAAAAQDGRVGYAENLVHSPAVVEAVAACRRLGSLTHLEVRFAQGRPDWGDHLEPSWGGGALFDLGVHAIALALLAAAPARVAAVEAQLQAGAGLELDDDATLTLAFDSGLRGRGAGDVAGTGTDVGGAGGQPQGRGASRTGAPPVGGGRRRARRAAVAATGAGVVAALPPRVRRPARGARPPTSTPDGSRHPGHNWVATCWTSCAPPTSSARTGREEPVPFTGPRDRTPLQLWRDG